MPMAFSTEARQAEEQFRSLQSTLNEINSLKFKFVTRRTTVSSEGQDNILDDDDNNNNSNNNTNNNNWRTEDIKKIDGKTRKMLTMYKMHHPKVDIDRLYVNRKEGGRGLVQIEAAYKAEIMNIAEYRIF